MTPVIQQNVRFRTSPQALVDLYLDSRRHSLSTGARAAISRMGAENYSCHSERSLRSEEPLRHHPSFVR
jgi:hypothetical protein